MSEVLDFAIYVVYVLLLLALVWAMAKKAVADGKARDLKQEVEAAVEACNREHRESERLSRLCTSLQEEAKQVKDEANTLLDELAKKNGVEVERLERVANGLQGDYERCSAEYEQSLAKVAELERLVDKRDDMLIKACAEADRFRNEADTLRKSAAAAVYDDMWYRCIVEFIKTTPGAKLILPEKKIVLDTAVKTDRPVLYRVDVPAVNGKTKTFRNVAEIHRTTYETLLCDSSGTVLARFPSNIGYLALPEPGRKRMRMQ